MARCTARFEQGTNGNTIATSDAGDETAWNTVSLGAGATAVYDNTHAHGGSLAAKLNGGAGNTTADLRFTSGTLGTLTDQYGRAYIYFTANPDANFTFINMRSGGAGAAGLRINTAGTLSLLDSGGAARATTSTSITLNAWVRVEWHVVHNTTTGSGELKLFNTPDSGTATETISFSNQNTSANGDSIRFQNTRAAVTYWLDDLVAGATSYPGPAQLVTSPVADSTAAAPSPTLKQTLAVAVAVATADAAAPTVTTTLVVRPGPCAATADVAAPTLKLKAYAVVADATAAAPSPTLKQTLAAAMAAATGSAAAPTLKLTLHPGACAATAAFPTPNLIKRANVAAAVCAATASIPAPQVFGDTIIPEQTGALTLTPASRDTFSLVPEELATL